MGFIESMERFQKGCDDFKAKCDGVTKSGASIGCLGCLVPFILLAVLVLLAALGL